MCYYNGIKVSTAEFIRLKNLEAELRNLQARPITKGFDYQEWPVIRPILDGKSIELDYMEWGFLPDKWFGIPIDTRAKAERFRNGFPDLQGAMKPGITTLNAMGEELLLPNKIYRDAALNRRCLFLSSGFYESMHIYPVGKRGQVLKTAVKYPYEVTLKNIDEQGYMFIAGIWQTWTDRETGEIVDTAALCTAPANSVNALVHNSKKRMPTVLTEELAFEWLQPGLSEKGITEIATYQYPAELMIAYSLDKETWQTNPARKKYNDVPEYVDAQSQPVQPSSPTTLF